MSHIWETEVSNSPTPKGSGWGGFWTAIIVFAFIVLLTAYVTGAEVRIKWNANPEPDIAEYRVCVGTTSGNYPTVSATTDTRYTVPALTEGTTYYFAVQAVNTAGITSEPSDEISYRVPTPPVAKKKLKLMKLQSSHDLKEWEDFLYLPVDPSTPTSLFLKAAIIEVETP